MKAWVVEKQMPIEKEPIKLVDDYPTPEPKDKEIRIRIKFCGICRTDLHIVEGDIPLHKKPVVPGHEIVGIVDKVGKDVKKYKVGDVVGVTWLNWTCGECKYCKRGEENYCPNIKRTGWDVDGGFAEYTVVHEDFALDLNGIDMPLESLAPWMCPGVAGYFAFKLAKGEHVEKLGMIGFGPTAYYILKIAKHLGIKVFISTRSDKHKRLASENDADWVGNITTDDFPEKADSIIYFPATGKLVERCLENLDISGTLVLAPVAMNSPMQINDYSSNMWGRRIETLYQVRRDYAREFIEIAKKLRLDIPKEIVEFNDLNDALKRLKMGEIGGLVQVLRVSSQ